MLLIGIAVIVQPQLGPFPGITAYCYFASQSASQFRGDIVGKSLSSKILGWIGALPYSLYLWHWPVLALLRYYSGAEVLSVKFSLVFILLTLMLSTTSYYVIDHIFRSMVKKVICWVVLVASVIGTAHNIVKINDG